MNKFIVNLALDMKRLIFLFVIVIAGCKNKQQTAATPGSMKKGKQILTGAAITSLEVLQFPRYAPDGERWDAYAPLSADPDIFIQLKWNDNVLCKTETHQDSPFGSPEKFTHNLPVDIKTFDQPLLVEAFDEDGVSSHDNMAYFSVILKDYEGKDFFELTKGEFRLKVGVQWTYQKQ